jgi:hypothetical protein
MRRTTTIPPLRAILLIAAESEAENIRIQLADAAMLRVKSATNAREATDLIPQVRPHALLIQKGQVAPLTIKSLRELAELTARRRVPVLCFEGPLPPDVEEQREALGIWEVLDGAFKLAPTVEALRAAIARSDKLRDSSKVRVAPPA